MYVNLDAEKRVLKEQSPYRLRKSGYTPIVVFGKGMESIPLQVQTPDLMKCLSQNVAIVELKVGNEKHLASIEQVQKDVRSPNVLHVAFHKLQKNQEAVVTLKVHLHGDAKGISKGGVIQLHQDALDVKGTPQNIPGHIEIDIAHMNVDDQILLKDIKLPSGVTFAEENLEAVVVSCHIPHAKEEAAPETEIEAVTDAATNDDKTDQKEE